MRSRKGIVSAENAFSLSFGLGLYGDKCRFKSDPIRQYCGVRICAPRIKYKKEMENYNKIDAIAKQIKNLWSREIVARVTNWYMDANSDAVPDYEELARYIVETGMGSAFIDQLTLKEDFLNEYFCADDYECRVAIDYVVYLYSGMDLTSELNLHIVFGDWDDLEMEVRKAMKILFERNK